MEHVEDMFLLLLLSFKEIKFIIKTLQGTPPHSDNNQICLCKSAYSPYVVTQENNSRTYYIMMSVCTEGE